MDIQCQFINEDGSRCGAKRMKSSPGGFCVGHSRHMQEEADMFSGSIIRQIESGMFHNFFGEDQTSWEGWKSILSAVFGLEMSEERLAHFQALTARKTAPESQVQECYIVAGRRSGKSLISAVIAVYLSLFRKYKNLRRGEQAHFIVVSPTRTHSQVVMSYIKAILQSHPQLREHVKKELKEEVQLKNGLTISVRTSNVVSARGLTIVGCILDEACFFPKDNSANPDKEVLASIVPAMATVPDSILLSISSPYAKQGMVFEKWEKWFGKDSDRTLIVQASSRQLNPTLSEEWIQEQLEEDYEVNRAEYLGEWRINVTGFYSDFVIEQAVDLDRPEIIPPQPGVKYFAFTDGASGSSGKYSDSFTLSIAHKEGERVIIDGVWETEPPFSPKSVVEQYAKLLKSYKVHTVTGDKWSLGVLGDLFRMQNIYYKISPLTTSQLYEESSVFFNHEVISIPNHRRLKNQMRSLERHTRTSGRDVITHPVNSHDDCINAVSGVVCEILLGLHLDLDSPEMQSRLPVKGGTKGDSISMLPLWERDKMVEEGKLHVLEVGGKKHYMRVNIHSKQGAENA